MKSARHSIIRRILCIVAFSVIAVANYSLFTIHFSLFTYHFSIWYPPAHIVVPFILGEIALHILTEALGNPGQRDEIFGDGAVIFARPDIVHVLGEGKVVKPAVRLKQRDGLDLRVAGHPKEQLAVVTGRVEPVCVKLQLRHLREMSHELICLALSVNQPDGAVGHAVGCEPTAVILGKGSDLT